MKTVELAPFGVALREAIGASPFKNRSAFLAAAGTQPPVLYRYETGEQSPRLDQISEWASLLGCPPERLIPFVKRPDPVPDVESVSNPELDEFLETDFGKQTTPEERETLAMLTRRHGTPRGVETYYTLISTLRAGFVREAAVTSYPPARAARAARAKRVPQSGDRALRPRVPKVRDSSEG